MLDVPFWPRTDEVPKCGLLAFHIIGSEIIMKHLHFIPRELQSLHDIAQRAVPPRSWVFFAIGNP